MKTNRLRRALAALPVVLLCVILGAASAAAAQMSDFDYGRYGSDYPDILRACGPEIYRGTLYLHYIQHGAAEGRVAYSIKDGSVFAAEPGEAQAYEHQKTLISARARLENAALAPDRDWPEIVLSCADNVVNNVGGSTPYEKLRACYEWVVNNTSYGYTTASWSGGSNMANRAYQVFETHVGVCDDYAAAFGMMARLLGYDARLQSGQTHTASGGYTGHTWCVINIHGVDYVFDPQIEDNLAKGGAVSFARFCKTYEELPGRYVLYPDDIVSDEVMASASNEALPRYLFGQARDYFNQVNAARARAGVAPLVWDEGLATAAFRVANGCADADAFRGVSRQGSGGTRFGAHGYIPQPGESGDLRPEYRYMGVYICQYDICKCLDRS